MFLKASLTASLLIATVYGQDNLESKLEYFEYARLMHEYGYSWEPIKVKTDDGYILTTFRVTGNLNNPERTENETYNPVMIMHGSTADACSWLAWAGEYLPLPLRLFDDGFDVYMTSNRGTKYCQEHVEFEVDEPEFWAWSWAEMGLYDDTANLSMIKEISGKEKVSYIGDSQGTVQMFYGLSKIEDSFLADSLFTFLALSPCTVAIKEGPDSLFTEGVFKWPDLGIFALNGPNWETDIETICNTFSQDVCDYAHGFDGTEPQSVQNQIHWAQNEILQRYQEYVPNELFMQGHTEADEIPLSSIDKVPISMWSGVKDEVCANKTARKTREIIGERVQELFNVPWAYHGEWGGGKILAYYPDLKQRLITPERHIFGNENLSLQ